MVHILGGVRVNNWSTFRVKILYAEILRVFYSRLIEGLRFSSGVLGSACIPLSV